MNNNGYIKLFRQIKDNPIYTDREPFCKRAAWTDILLSVNYTRQEILIGTKLLVCEPGQCLYSLETWAKRWNWKGKMQVRRFFDLLEKMKMIRTENVTVTLRITVCNWDSYQLSGDESVTHPLRSCDGLVTDLLPSKERKERKERKEDDEKSDGNFQTWISDLKADELFREQVARQHRIFDPAAFDQLADEFARMKTALGETNHPHYADLRKNFLFWIPKNLNANSTKNEKLSNGHIVSEDTMRRAFERVINGDS